MQKFSIAMRENYCIDFSLCLNKIMVKQSVLTFLFSLFLTNSFSLLFYIFCRYILYDTSTEFYLQFH